MAAETASALAPRAASSWKPVRTEEFSGTALPKGCGRYGGPYTGGASYWIAQDAVVSGGLLHLKLERRSAGGRSWTSGGVGCWDWAQTYGKFEIRAKVPSGKGIDSYFTLWPVKGASWTGVELLAPGPETAYVTNGHGTATPDTSRVAGRYSDAFHTYLVEWTPKLTRISMDGHVLYTSTLSYPGPRWFGMVVSNGDALTGVPDAATRLPAEFQIDYVRIFSFTGVEPAAVKPPVTPSSVPTTPAAIATPTPSAATKLPPTTSVASEPAAEAANAGLAGGVWPWLLGGSLIGGLAVVTLGYPRRRKERTARPAAVPAPPDDLVGAGVQHRARPGSRARH